MKNKKIVFVAVTIVLLFSATVSMAFLTEWYGGLKDKVKLVNDISDIEISYAKTFSSTADSNRAAVSDMIKSYDTTEVSYEEYMSIEAYIVFMLKHTLSKSETDQINALLKSGTTIQTISDIYDFYLTTNDDFSIVSDIASLEDKYWGKHWIENAYNYLTKNSTGVLSKDDIEKYAEALTREDMEYANLLCRKGVYTIHELLDKRVSGESWEILTDEIYSEISIDNASGSQSERNEVFKAMSLSELSDKDVITVYEISPFLSKLETPLSIDDIESDILEIETELKSKYNDELVTAINKMLKSEGLPERFMTAKEYEEYYNTHYLSAEANGLIDLEIKLLEQKGYSMEEIAIASADYNGEIFDLLADLRKGREGKML